jgi:molybdate transport system ATP-binding protein
MADPEALRAMGIREVAAMLPAVIAEHGTDGLTRLEAATGPLFLPGIDSAPGTRLRVRILAHDVILSRAARSGCRRRTSLRAGWRVSCPGGGPGVMIHVDVGGHEILARITRRAADQMALQPGEAVHAILKSMSVARDHVALSVVAPGRPSRGGRQRLASADKDIAR